MYRLIFKTAFRSLGKTEPNSFLNIFGLAIGIACASLIFLWVEDEMTFNDVYAKKGRLYAVDINFKYNHDILPWVRLPRAMAGL